MSHNSENEIGSFTNNLKCKIDYYWYRISRLIFRFEYDLGVNLEKIVLFNHVISRGKIYDY